jgi:predicted unusual protein kinase regulating ubiquinone biosynthesis (AarF/ABC1/UbiB family)
MSNIIIDIYKTSKYFVYFNLFLNVLILNLLNYKFTYKINDRLIRWLYYTINLNGCILIKIVQWLNTNLEILDIKDNNTLYDIFHTFYEDCKIHDLNYTKKIFLKEFEEDFDEVIKLDDSYNIKSGSIAQVYKGFYNNKIVAIKVVHPDIKYQLIFPIFYINLYKCLVNNLFFLKKYDTIFIFDSFFENLKNQTVMLNEYFNMKYFYDVYKENEYVLIPEPLLATKNILMMEFIDGVKFDTLNVSLLQKHKIIGLVNLFLKDNYFFRDYYHSDLHESNWKVIKHDDFYKIVIYDFGYISHNNYKELFKLICYYNDVIDIKSLLELLYNNCKNIDITKNEFIFKFEEYLENLDIEFREPFCDELIIKLYNFILINNICLESHMFELFISMILFKKYVIKYCNIKKIGINNSNCLVSVYFSSIEMCEKYNIFHTLKDYIKKTYINNPQVTELYEFENVYFQNLESSNSIDI